MADTVDLSGTYTTEDDEKDKEPKTSASQTGTVDLSGHYATEDQPIATGEKPRTIADHQASVSAAPSTWEELKGAVKHPINYLSNVEQDVEQGGGRTLVGRGLGHMQHGTMGDTGYTADKTPVASIMAGPIQGPPKIARGALRMGEAVKNRIIHPITSEQELQEGKPDEFVSGLNEATAGAIQTPGPLLMMSPEALPRAAAAIGASKVAQTGLGKLGVPDEYAELGGNVAGGLAAAGPEVAEKTVPPVFRAVGRAGQKAAPYLPGAMATFGALHGLERGGVAPAYFEGKGAGYLGKYVAEPFERGANAMATYKLSPEAKNVELLSVDAAKTDKLYDKAVKDHSKYAASEAKGPIDPEANPAYKKSLEAVQKARAAQAEAHYHLQEARDAAEAARAERAVPAVPSRPITPQEVAAARPAAPQAAPKPAGVDMGMPGGGVIRGQVPRMEGAPVHPQLTEGTPEAPKAPEAPKGEILPPEKPKGAAMRTLRVGEGGQVVDTETPLERSLREGLEGSKAAKPVAMRPPYAQEGPIEHKIDLGEMERRALSRIKPVPEVPERTEITGKTLGVPETPTEDIGAKVRAGEKGVPRTGERRERVRTPEEEQTTRLFKQARTELGENATSDQVMARVDELKAKEAKEPGLLGTEKELLHEGRSPEDLTELDRVLFQLTNQEQLRLGTEHGVNEAEHDLSKKTKDAHRLPVGKQAHVEATKAAMPEALKNHIIDAAHDWDNKNPQVFDPAAMNSQHGADRSRAILKEAQRRYAEGDQVTINASGESDVSQENLNRMESQKNKGIKTFRVKPSGERVPVLPADAADAHANRGEHIIEVDKDGNETIKDSGPGAPPLRPAKGYGEANVGVSKDAKDAAVKSLKDKMTRSSAGFDPTMLADAAKIGTYHLEAGAKEDTAFFAQAQKEKPNASLSEQLQHAPQALKEKGALPIPEKPEELLSKTSKNFPADVDKTIAGLHNESDIPKGSSFHAEEGNLVGKEGYSVGSKISLEQKIEGTKLSPEDVKAYRTRPDVAAALKEDPKAFVGSWEHAGNIYMDVSKFEPDLEKAKAIARENGQQAIYDLKGKKEINVPGTPLKDAPREGGITPVSGGAPGKATKPMPTGDQLVKKYGEADDPGRIAFLLADGRGVAQEGGMVHDEMLGGHPTDSPARREIFVNDAGAIRMRVHGALGDRQFAMSIPEKGITEAQLDKLVKYAPQLRSGGVYIEVARPEGGYKKIAYGKADAVSLEKAISDLVPIKEGKAYKDMSPEEQEALAAKGVSGRSQAAAAEAKELPELAEKHLTPEEKAGVTKSAKGTTGFIAKLEKMPDVQEFVDAAKAGEGGRKWYQRGTAAFDAMTKEAPEYFKDGDRDKFIGLLAATSPQQSVAMNLREALNTWTKYVDMGRPEGKPLEKMLRGELTLPDAKVPNALKALAGEPMWPDLSKNENFKVPSFAANLKGFLNQVTNDGWMGLFSESKGLGKPSNYHPVSVVTREAAKQLGWEPGEAQAAIWAFTKTFTEHGETTPEAVRAYSEDFADIMAHDQEVRAQLKTLGVDLGELDKHLKAIGEKPEVSSRASASFEDSLRKLTARIESARGKGSIPAPKTGTLGFPEDEGTKFEPSKFENEPLAKYKKSKMKY